MLEVLAAFIIAEAAYPDPVALCGSSGVAVLSSLRDVYLDPSVEKRRHLSEVFSTQILPSMRETARILDPSARACLAASLEAVSVYADRPSLNAAIETQAEIYARMWREENRRHGARSGEARAILSASEQLAHGSSVRATRYLSSSERLGLAERARIACAKRPGAACDAVSVFHLLLQNELPAEPVADRSLADAAAIWQRSASRYSSPLSVSRDLFAQAAKSSSPTSRVLFEWAADSLFEGPDPRAWNPASIAVLAEAAEQLAQAPQERNELTRAELQILLERLRPMGVARAAEVLGQPRPVIGNGKSNPVLDWSDSHFPGEFALYEFEAGRIDASADRTHSYRAAHYAQERWRETDANAPTLDLRSVATELQSLRARPQTVLDGAK